ncbi:TonB-dependent receptor [Sphingomonas sp. So64.6b]|uniref:TonB-dependent receptor n=1 Tax=Sphingomonas sp. So64.6b TaxID=2997354 RepID=UPI00160003A8|nr:TonB-dependent receptor [Sphingomonas sp. So64.6b]QNA86599.1 TonB-dependent receptor [Sphingomonas sp. So64.6b]
MMSPRYRRRRILLSGVSIALSALLAPAALAQTASPAPEIERNDGDIVVTAQRRAENLQDVPLSVAVVGNEQLTALKFNETSDLQYLVPSVTLINAAGPRNFGFFIRGIGTSTFSSEAIEGSTAYVLDGVVLGQSGSSVTDLPDVERIEVLRGPQGTLFGKNASAGVVNVVTRRPSREFEARGSVSWAWPDNDRRFSAYVSGPLTDTLRFSLSGRRNVRDGYVRNLADGRRFNNRDEFGFRGKVEFEPSPDLTITAIGDYFERNADCCIWTLYQTVAPAGAVEAVAAAAGIVPGLDNLEQNVNGDVFSEARSRGFSVQGDYRFGGGYTLTSITAWRRWQTHDGLDSDSSPFNLLDSNYADLTQNQFSQELRLASPVGNAIDYVVGAYYFDSDVRSRSIQVFPTVPLPFFSRRARVVAETRNMALFGQANLNLSDRFKLIAGARVVNERVEADKSRVDPRFNLTDAATGRTESTALVWRAGAQYDLSHDANVFATVTRGFKGGGFDTNIGNGLLREVAPERPTNYEVGIRTFWPALRLTLNATAFLTKVKDYQTAGRDPVTATYPIVSSNAKTRGVEFDLAWRPVDPADLTVSFSGSYVDAEWGAFRNAPCFGGQTLAEGCVPAPNAPAGSPGVQQDLTGARLPFSPSWQLNLGGSYGIPLSDALKLRLDLGTSYRSTQLIAFPNNPRARQGGYTLVNAAIAIAGKDDHWKLSVFGKNLLDKQFAVTMFSTPFGNARSLSQFRTYESQRSIGLALDVAF